jgi:methionyl-tRNA synthetase
VPSDVFSRYMRMAGHDVLMVSGTDEHGTPILVQADKEGVTPREFVDRFNHGSSPRTSRTSAWPTTCTPGRRPQPLRRRARSCSGVHANGYMIEQTQLVAISPSTGRTLPDRYIEGTCPICGYGEARGDQCDNCGNQLDPAELIDPRSKINGETPRFDRDSSTSSSTCRRWPARCASGSTGARPRAVASQRHQVQPRTSSTTSSRGR